MQHVFASIRREEQVTVKTKAWQDFRLYVITAEQYHHGRSLIEVMEQALAGGAQMLQLRNKTGTYDEVLQQAKALRILTRRYNVPLIINDNPYIAIEADADGVHLGQEDMPIAAARELLGAKRIIGISTHSLEQALAAERGGADYIGVGPVFPTNTKPGRAPVTTSYVSEAARHVTIPFVAIGGIGLDNVDAVLAAGATRICAVSAIVGSDDPARICGALLERIAVNDQKAESALFYKKEAADVRPEFNLIVNGLAQFTTAATIETLIMQLGQQNKRLVVELDGSIVQRPQWAETALYDGASIELIQFVGGG